MIEFLRLIKVRTKSSSQAVNRIVKAVDPNIHLHSNCSVTMISKDTYEEFHLPYELKLADELHPYGIHHCGVDMHRVAGSYAKTNAVMYDVGWGSDIKYCREKLPDAMFSVRISPVKMNTWNVEEAEREILRCLKESGPIEKTAICCINMDADIREDNLVKLLEIAANYNG